MRILIIDDISLCRILLTEFLSPFGDCISTDNSTTAMDIFRLSIITHQRFDLICINSLMVDMDYRQIKWELRKIELEDSEPNCKEVKMLLTSSLIDLEKILEEFSNDQIVVRNGNHSKKSTLVHTDVDNVGSENYVQITQEHLATKYRVEKKFRNVMVG